MRHVLGQHVSRWRRLTISIRSSSSLRTVPIQRSAIAFARDACTGVRRMRMPSLANTASKVSVKLAVAIPDQEGELSRAIAEIHQEVARLLSYPGSAGVRRAAHQVDAAGGVLHDEQHGQPVK